jgi:NSS family neurotransmitter:Na+ symporter
VTSGISLLETPVATLVDSFGVPRRRATVLVSVLLAATGSGLALTSSVFQFVSGTLADLMLTVGLFAFTVIVGWLLRGDALAEFRAGTDRFEWLAKPWLLTVSWVLPVVVLFLLTNTLASLAGISVGLGGRVIIAVIGTVALAVVVRNGSRSDRLSSH